jgi:hypothetical protein
MIAFWDVLLCSLVELDRRFRVCTAISLMMEAVRLSETSVCFNESTRGLYLRRCHLHTHCLENLIFLKLNTFLSK